MNLTSLIFAAAMTFAAGASAEIIRVEVNADTESVLPTGVKECKETARQKLVDQAKAFGIQLNMSSLRVTGYDKRGILGGKATYTWWSADVTNLFDRYDLFPDGAKRELVELVRYSGGECL